MGMNDFYIILLFDGAEIKVNNSCWKIHGQTFISKDDVHNIISCISYIQKVTENLYRVNNHAELYLHLNDNNDVVGINVKDSFDNLEKDIKSLYEVFMCLSKKYSISILINDKLCEIKSEAELSDHIKRIYKDKYLFYQRSKKYHNR